MRKADTVQGQWNYASLIAFRLVFVYLILFNSQDVLRILLGPFYWFHPYAFIDSISKWWYPLVSWVGRTLLHVRDPIAYHKWAPSDSTYSNVLCFCFILIAATITGLWTVADRRTCNYDRLHGWFRLFLRLILAHGLINYGMSKVFQNQFPPLDLHTMLQPVGELAPKGLLWASMGYSKSYSAFGGWMELVAAVLLLIPRLTLLGALLSVALMTNIFLLNLFYNVWVKLYSLHLLFMSILLVVPDTERLLNLFVFNKNAKPVRVVPLFRQRWANLCVQILPVLLGSYWLCQGASWESAAEMEKLARPPFYGVWEVSSMTGLDDAAKSLLSDSHQLLRRLIFETPGEVRVETHDLHRYIWRAIVSKDEKTMTMGVADGPPEEWRSEHPKWFRKYDLKVDRPDAQTMTLTGAVVDRQTTARLAIQLKKADEFMLMKYRFHWISDPPYEN